MKTRKMPVADLAPYHRNARRGNVDAIVESLEANGQYKPIVVNVGTHTGRPNEVLVGNHTREAAARLEWATLDAVMLDVDDEQARRIVLADNRTSDLANYDDALLADLLQDGDLIGTGFTDVDLGELLTGGAPGAADFIEPPAEDDYREQFAVTVVCATEAEQEALYTDLTERGYTARVVTV